MEYVADQQKRIIHLIGTVPQKIYEETYHVALPEKYSLTLCIETCKKLFKHVC